MKIEIYHNPRWSKSRESVKILKKINKPFTIIEYLKDGLNKQNLNDVLSKLNLDPIQIIRINDKKFKELHLTEADLTNKNKLLDILIENPIILERPIIINNNKGIIGRPPENIYKIL